MAILKQSTAYTRMFLLVESSDHITGLTGATASVSISKAGAAFASAAGTVTEVADGWYKIALTTADTDTLGDLAFHVTATSADPTDFVDQVTANILGDTLPANAKEVNGVSTSSVTTINANLGTTQPVNFTGTGASALVKSDAVDVGGTAQTGADIGALLGTPAGTSVSADIAAVKTDTAAIKTSTDNLPASPAATGDAMTLTAAYDDAKTAAQAGDAMTLTTAERTSVADALLDRDMSTGTDSGSDTVRTVRQALRMNRNKISISSGTMTVTKEDDTTASWTASVTTDASADPITGIDPA